MHRTRPTVRRLRAVASILLLLGLLGIMPTPRAEATITTSSCLSTIPNTIINLFDFSTNPSIQEVMIANTYVDNPLVSQKRWGQFVVAFDITKPKVDPAKVKSIVVTGPNGYVFNIKTTAFSILSRNGYIDDAATGMRSFVAMDARRWLEPGRYDITVTYLDGKVTRKGRTLALEQPLLDEYLRLRSQLVSTPKGILPAGTPLTNLRLDWTTLAERGGPTAWYAAQVATVRYGTINPTGRVYFDNIHLLAVLGPLAGRNKSEVVVDKTLKPATQYAWNAQIMDSNCLGDVDLSIQPRATLITTPAATTTTP